MSLKVYLAGPAVFYNDPIAESQRLKGICADFGLKGIFPFDAELDLTDMSKHEAANAIYLANIELIKSADAVIADMQPFRGPGMDGGTAFEMGFARALGKTVIGYGSSDTYLERCRSYYQGLEHLGENEVDPKGLTVEDFDLKDNLMMACGADHIVETFEEACALLKRLDGSD